MIVSDQAKNLAIGVLLAAQAKEYSYDPAGQPNLKLVKAPKEKAPVPSTNGKNLVSAPGVGFDNHPGQYTATEFMMRYRRARDRNEIMVAVNGFIGYDNKVAFSVNEYNAKTAAQKALKPPPTCSHPKTVETKGYVAGIPDNNMKRIADLLGREKLAAEALVNFELQISNLTEGSTEHLTAVGMAEIERERLLSIRADLDLLVK